MITITKELIDLLLTEAASRLGVSRDRILVEQKNLYFDLNSPHSIDYMEQGRLFYLLSPPVSLDAAIVELSVSDNNSGFPNTSIFLTNRFDYTSYFLQPICGIFFDSLEQGGNSSAFYLPVLRFTRL